MLNPTSHSTLWVIWQNGVRQTVVSVESRVRFNTLDGFGKMCPAILKKSWSQHRRPGHWTCLKVMNPRSDSTLWANFFWGVQEKNQIENFIVQESVTKVLNPTSDSTLPTPSVKSTQSVEYDLGFITLLLCVNIKIESFFQYIPPKFRCRTQKLTRLGFRVPKLNN